MTNQSIDDLRARIGEEIRVSDWVTVGQDMINGFADVTGDHQFIHVDAERAAATPIGGTIAHGFLVLSLLPMLVGETVVPSEGVAFTLNYGVDKVRMTAPVPAGSRVRGRATLSEVSERAPGQWMVVTSVKVEIENQEKPALVADWRNLCFAG